MPGGLYGVDIFLVLSGFLITTILVEKWHQTGGIGYGLFLKRRIRRLYPPILFLIGAYLAASIFLSGRFGILSFSEALKPSLVAALYLENLAFGYNVIDVHPVFLHLWSLAVEMWFYLLWPLLLLGVLRLSTTRNRAIAVAVLIVTATVAQQFRVRLTPDGGSLTFEGRSLPIVLGCALALGLPWIHTWWRDRGSGALGWFSAVVIVICFFAPRSVMPLEVGLPVASLASAGLILAMVLAPTGRLTRLLDTPLSVAIGVRSYSLYLWHAPILAALTAQNAPGWSMAQRGVGAIILIFVLTEAAYRLVELPALKGLRGRPRGIKT